MNQESILNEQIDYNPFSSDDEQKKEEIIKDIQQNYNFEDSESEDETFINELEQDTQLQILLEVNEIDSTNYKTFEIFIESIITVKFT